MPYDFAFDWNLLLLPVVGFAVGLLVTTVGGGGGFFYVPALTLLFNIPTQLAVATSLATVVPTTVFGSIGHYRHGNVNLSVGLVFGAGGVAGAIVGAYVSSLIEPALLGKLFGTFVIALGVPMAFAVRRRARSAGRAGEGIRSITWAKGATCLTFGLLSGVMAGLFGVSGTPPVIVGLYVLGFPVPIVVGTSVFILLFNAISGLIGHLALSQFDLTLVLFTGSGSIIGASMGPILLARLNAATLEKTLGPVFTVLPVVLGLAMILR